jgi:FAD/FMN-containing dehydrogenase/Fe-S oxidoreductase
MTNVVREQEHHLRHSPTLQQADMAAMIDELRSSIAGEVRFDDGSRALYATDASNYRQPPIGVVIPRDADDVVQTMAICRRYRVPVLGRGGGTSLAGQCCNVAVVLDMSKYFNKVLEIDAEQRRARVQPGCRLDDLRDAAEQHHLTFGPDPATHKWCTLGGMIGNNACGVHSVLAGKTVDNIEEMDIVTYDGLRMRVGPTSEEELEQIISAGGRRGEIYAGLKSLCDRYADLIRERYPRIPRRVSGYNLDELLPENGFNVARALVGTEGTCAMVLEATTRLVHSPPLRSLLVLGYPDVYEAAAHILEVRAHEPVGLEGMDDQLVTYMERKGLNTSKLGLLPEGAGWLLVEFGGDTKDEANQKAHRLMDELRQQEHPPSMKLYDRAEEEDQVWLIRESGLAATAFVPGMKDTWPGWEDSAVAPERVSDYLRDLRALLNKYDYGCSLYGHFGDGCIHTRIDFDLETQEGINTYLAFIDEASDLVLKYGGSFTGEHGSGQARAALMPKLFGEELMQAFGEFKALWDPDNRMNPGKVMDPYRPDEHLRLGTDYQPQPGSTYFQFPDDQGSFARATMRCVGVGKCRSLEGGTMCPSYQVTHEEEHTTRGRAHMLFEMLRGNVVADGWHDEHVRESLDLCLSCKGCKNDCPVNVDMATYKAEFLAHYYEGKLRPRHAYAFGLIFYWARLAALMPKVANFFTQTPGLSRVAKFMADVAPQRKVPAFAPQTFKAWFRQRGTHHQERPGVILWPDTFNNHFHPEVLQAGVEVLEAAGYRVVVPEAWLCCGRPLYDFGMLGHARHLLQDILTKLRTDIRAGTPIIGLEPSCVSVFRDELRNFFPHDEDAKRLYRQTYTLGEFLTKIEYQPPALHRKAVVHGHCHHKAIMHMDGENSILREMGLDYELLDSGCCGMAGAFGFEHDKYAVSVKAGERVLLPAVRKAEKDTLIITDGFSCHEQVSQLTDRTPLHLSQVLQMALHEPATGSSGAYPEQRYMGQHTNGAAPMNVRRAVGLGAGALLLGSAVAWGLRQVRKCQ